LTRILPYQIAQNGSAMLKHEACMAQPSFGLRGR
jgi:hypothetical protein